MWAEVCLHVSVIENGDLCHGDDHHTLSFFVIVGAIVVIIIVIILLAAGLAKASIRQCGRRWVPTPS